MFAPQRTKFPFFLRIYQSCGCRISPFCTVGRCTNSTIRGKVTPSPAATLAVSRVLTRNLGFSTVDHAHCRDCFQSTDAEGQPLCRTNGNTFSGTCLYRWYRGYRTFRYLVSGRLYLCARYWYARLRAYAIPFWTRAASDALRSLVTLGLPSLTIPKPRSRRIVELLFAISHTAK